MKVVSYLGSVPSRNSNNQKTELLHRFAQGAITCGDSADLSNSNTPVDCDVAVIQGWVYDQVTTPHLRLRKNVIDYQIKNNRYVVTADANCFLFADPKNKRTYLRYSFNGIFPRTGIYCDTNPNPQRWQKLKQNLKIDIKPYTSKGSEIILLVQRTGGWSMKGYDVSTWIKETLSKIRSYTDRRIVIRPHPGDKKFREYYKAETLAGFNNVVFSDLNVPMYEAIKNCYAVVNHNSSAAVGPIVEGCHCFLTDPTYSQCNEVSNTDFSLIESPKTFNREKWLERLSMSHWNFEELQSGEAWAHMRTYVQ